jgi:predicted acylesterase/phospholipase RssA
MGAIVGGLYASGYSGREIDSLTRSLPLTTLFRTYEPRVPLSLGVIQPLVVWQEDGGHLVFQRAAVLEPEVNALLNAGFLRGNLVARGNFDSLPIPFRAVATDLLSGSPVVFDHGDLARAVRASAAIPLLFEPERVDGRFLGDGGLSANVPVAVARKAGATRLIVSYTTERRPDSLNLRSPLVLIDLLIGNLFRQSPDSLGPADLAIHPDVDGFQSLNFSRHAVAELVRRGEEAASATVTDASCLPRRAVPRPRQRQSPRLTSLSFTGEFASDSEYVRKRLGLNVGSRIDVPGLQKRLHALGTSDRITSLWLFPSGSVDSLRLQIEPLHVPSRVLALGAVYDNDLGSRVWLGSLNRDFLVKGVDLETTVALGELRQDLQSGIRLGGMGVSFVPTLDVRFSRELVRQFIDGDEEPSLKVLQGLSFAGLEGNWSHGWHSRAGLETRWWGETHGSSHLTLGPRFSVFKVGPVPETLFQADAVATRQYRRIEVEGTATVSVGKLKVKPHARFGYGDELPDHRRFVVGGADGFAGLHIGEIRGDREIFGSLIFLYPVLGKLQLRFEPMVGNLGDESHAVPRGELMTGVRMGLNLSTTLGPVRVEYGLGREGRDAVLVRIGRWF